MLSSAEEDLLAGKIPAVNNATIQPLQDPILPLPVQQSAVPAGPQGQGPIWSFEYWKSYFNVDTKDV
jgi:hypothetical protein